MMGRIVAKNEIGSPLDKKTSLQGMKTRSCVIAERLERSTGSLEGCCSIQLSYVTIAFAAQK